MKIYNRNILLGMATGKFEKAVNEILNGESKYKSLITGTLIKVTPTKGKEKDD